MKDWTELSCGIEMISSEKSSNSFERPAPSLPNKYKQEEEITAADFNYVIIYKLW